MKSRAKQRNKNGIESEKWTIGESKLTIDQVVNYPAFLRTVSAETSSSIVLLLVLFATTIFTVLTFQQGSFSTFRLNQAIIDIFV